MLKSGAVITILLFFLAGLAWLWHFSPWFSRAMAEVHHSCELRMFVHSVRRRATWNKRQTGKTWMDLVESLRMNEILHQICRLVLDLFPTAQIQSILHCAPRFSSSIFFLLSSFLCFCRNFGVWAFEPISPLWVWSFLLSLFLPYSLPFFVVFFCGLHWSPCGLQGASGAGAAKLCTWQQPVACCCRTWSLPSLQLGNENNRETVWNRLSRLNLKRSYNEIKRILNDERE